MIQPKGEINEAPKHGGARPGAGRKRRSTVEHQQSNIGIVLAAADKAAIQSMVDAMIARARHGDVRAFLALAPFVFGAPTQRQEHTGPEGGPVVFSLNLGDAKPTDE